LGHLQGEGYGLLLAEPGDNIADASGPKSRSFRLNNICARYELGKVKAPSVIRACGALQSGVAVGDGDVGAGDRCACGIGDLAENGAGSFALGPGLHMEQPKNRCAQKHNVTHTKLKI